MAKAIICFYFGTSLPALVTRLGTQRKGQLFSDVPSHCAIYIETTNLVYEFISTGCQSRSKEPQDFYFKKIVYLSLPEKTTAFLKSCLKIKYGWFTILDVVLCKFLPDRLLSWYKRKAKHICSWLVLIAIERGGYKVPSYIDVQIDPVSPNDLWFMLKEYPNGI